MGPMWSFLPCLYSIFQGNPACEILRGSGVAQQDTQEPESLQFPVRALRVKFCPDLSSLHFLGSYSLQETWYRAQMMGITVPRPESLQQQFGWTIFTSPCPKQPVSTHGSVCSVFRGDPATTHQPLGPTSYGKWTPPISCFPSSHLLALGVDPPHPT